MMLLRSRSDHLYTITRVGLVFPFCPPSSPYPLLVLPYLHLTAQQVIE